MYTFYNTLPEKRDAWRNAYEIKAAALEHEKRRFQDSEETTLVKPQVLKRENQSGWASVLKASTRLLTILVG